jgi:hypothetical protein
LNPIADRRFPSARKLLIFMGAASLFTSLVQAQQKTHFSVGLKTGYILAYDKDSEDWGPLVGAHIQLQEGHWALGAEIDYVPKWTFFMTFVDLAYNLRPSEEGKFSPYVSIGIGGHGEMGENLEILTRLALGMRLRIMRVQGGAFFLNVNLTSLHAFPFSPFAFGPNGGLEFLFR